MPPITYWATDMPAFSEACGSFHVKSSFTSFVTVFVTVRVLPFVLTVVLVCSSTLMVSTLGARSYTDQRYWSMHASLRTHASEASSGLTFTSGSASGTFMTGSATAAAASEWARAAIASMRARAASTCRSGFARAAQSRTAKLPHTKQPNPFKSRMFAPITLGPIHLHQRKARACDSFVHKLKVGEVGAQDDCEPGRVGVELSQSGR